MKLLVCKICNGEIDIIGNDHGMNKKIKCRSCGFTNSETASPKEPEVLIIRRRKNDE